MPALPITRSPAVPFAVCLALGIVIDYWVAVNWKVWVMAACCFAGAWCFIFFMGHKKEKGGSQSYFSQPRFLSAITSLCLLAGAVCLGGGRHHWCWSLVDANDVSRFVPNDIASHDDRVLVQLTGEIDTAPVIRRKSMKLMDTPWAQLDRTVCRLKCVAIQTNTGKQTATGFVRLQVKGHLLHAQVGDTVTVHGWLQSPGEPMNPGQFDYANYLRSQQIRSIIYVDDPDAVSVLQRGGWSWKKVAARERQLYQSILRQQLSEQTFPIANTMLLGDRSEMDQETQTRFMHSGLLHILAISGLHVGILAGFVWLICRLFRCSPTWGTGIVITVVIGYALLAGLRPSVVRAAIVIVILSVSQPWHRRVISWNSLAIAAIVLLIFRPHDLFHIGAQLSFLSVIALLVSNRWCREFFDKTDEEEQLELQEVYSPENHSPENSALEKIMATTPTVPLSLLHWFLLTIGRLLRTGGKWLVHLSVPTAAILFFTTPLVAARFHIVAPIGFVLNLMLLPIAGFIFGVGFLSLLAGSIHPSLATVPGTIFDITLQHLLNMIDWANNIPAGHGYVAGPSEFWLLGYYGLLLAVLALGSRLPRPMWGWCAVFAWMLAGMFGLFPSTKPADGLRCSFLSTGHGVAILVEMPNGKTLLYDAGALGNARYATDTVQNALWKYGHNRLDLIVVSHADMDHFNGVPGLLETIPVGKILATESFLETDQAMVREFHRIVQTERVPIETVQIGDRLQIDPNVSVRILHPGTERYESDNADSIVLEIEYAGRRILITGDLEKEGLQQLMTQPTEPVDVMLSPHHGSLIANPPEFAEWAKPRYVVASCGRRNKFQQLQKQYSSGTSVFATAYGGAVIVNISPQGKLTISRGSRP